MIKLTVIALLFMIINYSLSETSENTPDSMSNIQERRNEIKIPYISLKADKFSANSQ